MGPLLVRGMMWVPLGEGRVGPLLVRGMVWVPLGEGRVGPLLVRGMVWVPLGEGRVGPLLVRGMVWVPLGEGRVEPLLSEQWKGQRCSGLLYSQVYVVRLRPVLTISISYCWSIALEINKSVAMALPRSKSYNKYIIAVPWVGQYGEIFSSRVAVLALPVVGPILPPLN